MRVLCAVSVLTLLVVLAAAQELEVKQTLKATGL